MMRAPGISERIRPAAWGHSRYIVDASPSAVASPAPANSASYSASVFTGKRWTSGSPQITRPSSSTP